MKFSSMRFPSTKAMGTGSVVINDFYGCDFSSGATNIDPRRSPNCENMIRSSPGRVRKRLGFYKTNEYDGRINGHYSLDGVDIIHAGTKLYAGTELISSDMNDAFSVAKNFDKALYLLDGKHYYKVTHDGTFKVANVSETAYVPRIVINKNPDGTGGITYEDINLMSDKWTESFYVGEKTATATTFQLSLENLNNEPVTAKVLQEDGSFIDKAENTDFTVDRKSGSVTFTTAPGKSPLAGADNVYITAAKDRSESRSRITNCDTCIVYGETGTRLFVTGDPNFKNRDFWSAQNDFSYFSDLSYSILGEDSERIVGYSIVGDRIAAHKSGTTGAVYVRTGSTITDKDELGNPIETFAFKTGNVITGHGAIAAHSFVPTDNEPLFLSSTGIFALTASDVTGERYVQSRSFYINPKLLAENDILNAYACLHKDFYFIAAGSGVYVLDLLQKRYEQGEPYSNFQYECFYLTGIPARVIWDSNGELYFGTADGKVCKFCTDETTTASYNDTLDGTTLKPVMCQWETPDIDGKTFYSSKHFRYLACRLSAFVRTSVNASAMCSGKWIDILTDARTARFFSWDDIDWSKWTWSTDTTPKVLGRKLDMRNLDKVRFRFSNANAEPFGIENIAVEYRETKKYRG
jgi:hypothetical protein